jgi:hypothetical protein
MDASGGTILNLEQQHSTTQKTISYGKGEYYTGGVIDGMREGTGTLYSYKQKYVGEWH